jgi:alkanesulfonate monooxygenase
MISGSSPAGADAARRLGAVGVRYPRPVLEEAAPGDGAAGGTPQGVRVGIIARETAEEAWRVARERFPEDRRGEITHALAMKVSDSHWHRQLSEAEAGGHDESEPYWLGPFKTGRTFCPYLVGSHERVAEEVRRYVEAGVGTFVLDIPPDEEELAHTGVVLRLAERTPA